MRLLDFFGHVDEIFESYKRIEPDIRTKQDSRPLGYCEVRQQFRPAVDDLRTPAVEDSRKAHFEPLRGFRRTCNATGMPDFGGGVMVASEPPFEDARWESLAPGDVLRLGRDGKVARLSL